MASWRGEFVFFKGVALTSFQNAIWMAIYLIVYRHHGLKKYEGTNLVFFGCYASRGELGRRVNMIKVLQMKI